MKPAKKPAKIPAEAESPKSGAVPRRKAKTAEAPPKKLAPVAAPIKSAMLAGKAKAAKTAPEAKKPAPAPVAPSSAEPAPKTRTRKAPAKKPAPTAKAAKPARKTKTPVALQKVEVPAPTPEAVKPAPKSESAKPPSKGESPKPSRIKPAIPPILLEGDAPATTTESGPGHRYVQSSVLSSDSADLGQAAALPEAYGTEKLLLTARDPHWLHATWDLTRAQLSRYNAQSSDGHLVLRVYADGVTGEPHVETHLHPESKSWFIHVGKAGARYVAELGYYDRKRTWKQISKSKSTIAPPDSLSDDTSVQFATLPIHISFEEVLNAVQEAVQGTAQTDIPLIEAIRALRESGDTSLPELTLLRLGDGAPASDRQTTALAQAVTIDSVRRVWIGSLEITELVRRKISTEASSLAAAQFGQASAGELLDLPGGLSSLPGSVSSGGGPGSRKKGFWFNLNAELIIYGATEPDASVSIGGRRIKLRPDGSFSFRFALPDGAYQLPAVAVSAEGDERRAADLQFSRQTDYQADYQGNVTEHPQDPELKTPRAANVG